MDNRKEDEKRFWQRSAAKYDRRVSGYSVAYRKIIAYTRRYVNRDSRVLDAACGTGIIALPVAPYVNRLWATDLSPNMVEVAKGKAAEAGIANITFAVADGYELPFDSGSFDLVLLVNVLHVVKDPAALLAEMHRVLADGGVLLAATNCASENAGAGQRLLLSALRLVKVTGMIKYLQYYTKADIDALVRQAGFAVLETENLTPMPGNYFVAAKK